MSEITLDRQIAEVRRELVLRRSVYPRLVANGKLSQQNADDRVEVMVAVRATLKQLRDEQRAQVAPELF